MSLKILFLAWVTLAGVMAEAQTAFSLLSENRAGTYYHKDDARKRIYILTSLPDGINDSADFAATFAEAERTVKAIIAELGQPDLYEFRPYQKVLEHYEKDLAQFPQVDYRPALLEIVAHYYGFGYAEAPMQILAQLKLIKYVVLKDNGINIKLAPAWIPSRQQELLELIAKPEKSLRRLIAIYRKNIQHVWARNFIEGVGTPYASLDGIVHRALDGLGDLVDLKIVNLAHAADLQAALHDPLALAVIYVAHANGGYASAFSTQLISDFEGNDISDLFRDVHPNIRFLGVVGCQANRVLERFKVEGAYAKNPRLWLWAENDLVLPQTSTIETTAFVAELLKKQLQLEVAGERDLPKPASFRERVSLPVFKPRIEFYRDPKNWLSRVRCFHGGDTRLAVKITRDGEDLSEVSLRYYDHLIGVMPSGGRHQEQVFYISATDLNAAFGQSLSLHRLNDGKPVELGELRVESAGIDWRLKVDRNQKPIGAPLIRLFEPSKPITATQLAPYAPEDCGAPK